MGPVLYFKNAMPPKTLLRLGLCFLFLALIVYFYSEHWLKTRIFLPLDVPVNLDTRQLKSPPFQINMRETYFVALWLDYSVDDWYDDDRCNDRALLGSQWRVNQPPGLQTVRVRANYGRLFRHGTCRVELHAYSD
jgi:hypothetical protein